MRSLLGFGLRLKSTTPFNTLSRALHSYPIYQVYGANTDVGKTVFSAALCKTWIKQNRSVLFVKPVQTGFELTDGKLVGDAAFVSSFCNADRRLTAKCLYSWKRAASPHLAAQEENRVVPDIEIQNAVKDTIDGFPQDKDGRKQITVVETAGGTLSPSPSLSSQADLYRPLRYPVILVADPKLGGISVTLTAYESLVLRGYDVACILTMDGDYVNQDALVDYMKRNTVLNPYSRKVGTIPVFTFTELKPETVPGEQTVLFNWFEQNSGLFEKVTLHLEQQHQDHLDKIHSLAGRASASIWWPFTQHQTVKTVTTIATELVDSCGSWWTQGLGHGNVDISRSAAYALGRYGHVMFPENAHEPAVELAELSLKTLGKGWASRVFYSDNGSSATEIALKMAFRYKWKQSGEKGDKPPRMSVIGIQDGYHGDTLGAMDAVSPSVFNEKESWYEPKGVWFSPPTVELSEGAYHIRLPEWISKHLKSELEKQSTTLSTRSQVMSTSSRLTSALYTIYSDAVASYLKSASANHRFGATILEPIIHGAGGMIWVDPLFQRVVVEQSRRIGVPVIFDEIFVGCTRLGHFSMSEVLGVSPDVGCYGKLLTGGAVPMALTLSTEAVYDSFTGPSKLDALLHGHSYTAHTVGCTSALTSLRAYDAIMSANNGGLPGAWDESFAMKLSHNPNISRVLCIGTVLAIELRSDSKGYGSDRAREVIQSLRQHEVFARPIGNVIYWMTSPSTTKDQVNRYQAVLEKVLQMRK